MQRDVGCSALHTSRSLPCSLQRVLLWDTDTPLTRRTEEMTEKNENLPNWPTGSASAVYSKAYRHMEKNGADQDLIDALNKGDEERIKAILLDANTRKVMER